MSNVSVKLIDLPNEILANILSYLTFDEIAKKRLVCRKWNAICGQQLNLGFISAERRHSVILKKVKSLLPRRESERRVHQLARHSDILTAIETRISMLRMTFIKYIDVHACSFIPGKVIDEIFRILALVENTRTPPRTHEVLQELRDISSMAMEHFDEKIAPNLKIRPLPYPAAAAVSVLNNNNNLNNTTTTTTSAPFIGSFLMRDRIRKDLNIMQQRSLQQKQQIVSLKQMIAKLVCTVKRQNTIIRHQNKRIREQNIKLNEEETNVADLKRHVEEWDLKFADLVAELSRCRDEGTTEKSQQTPFKSNIKPRMARINQFDQSSRKRKSPIVSFTIRNKIARNDDLLIIDQNETSSPSFLSASLETLIKSPITSIKSRKRKIH